jgi:hypothetical protein
MYQPILLDQGSAPLDRPEKKTFGPYLKFEACAGREP